MAGALDAHGERVEDPAAFAPALRRALDHAPALLGGRARWRCITNGLRGSLLSQFNANLPAVYFGVPAAQVVEVGLEVEI
jgi:KUP system potassium uptake protein